MTATEADKKDDSIRIAMLHASIGPDSLDRYNQFGYGPGEDKKKYDIVLSKFDDHFQGFVV